MEHTITEEFNKILEVQQSEREYGSLNISEFLYTNGWFADVVAGIDGAKEPDYIEEMIDKQRSLIHVLRLLCLMSLVQGGLKTKIYEHMRREIVQVRDEKEKQGASSRYWSKLARHMVLSILKLCNG